MTPLVDVAWLAAHLGDPDLRVADVRWTLGKPAAGRAAWERSRIPGATFLDIDVDLSAIGDRRAGRHPLPAPERLAATLAAHGIGAGARVVAYDDAGGTHAARLWWLLGGLGIECAVLDGGLSAWIGAGQLLDERPPPPPLAVAPVASAPTATFDRVVDKELMRSLVSARLGAPGAVARVPILLDARAPERYRGEVEPIDPQPGHIPTALSAPTAANLDTGGRFKSPEVLREQFAALGVTDGSEVICYCGSGVTACHDLLALELAGLVGARLYAGSYSEWSNDPDLPVHRG